MPHISNTGSLFTERLAAALPGSILELPVSLSEASDYVRRWKKGKATGLVAQRDWVIRMGFIC